ncbi:MAG: hypothetical protein H3Z53_06200 [archaeon]|nr:hypothetical protein [archaeon]MCP8313947.1 hypothetical protein [archaeon]
MTPSENWPQPIRINEEELQQMVEKDLGRLELGLIFIDHYVPTGAGEIDTLALDAAGNPVVIEYKVVDEDGQGLVQSLGYAGWLSKNPDTLLRLISERKPDIASKVGDVRIILVAPNFKDRVINAITMVSADIRLKRYVPFEHSSIGKWLYLEDVSPTKRPVKGIWEIDDIFEGRYSAMRTVYDMLEDKAKKLGEDVAVYATQDLINFQREKGYIFARVVVYVDRLEVGLVLPSTKENPKLQDASRWMWGTTRTTHYLILKREEDVNREVQEWLRSSYETSKR